MLSGRRMVEPMSRTVRLEGAIHDFSVVKKMFSLLDAARSQSERVVSVSEGCASKGTVFNWPLMTVVSIRHWSTPWSCYY